MQLLGGREGGMGGGDDMGGSAPARSAPAQRSAPAAKPAPAKSATSFDDMDDDIPF
jgi:single-strand DNA-binding protein